MKKIVFLALLVYSVLVTSEELDCSKDNNEILKKSLKELFKVDGIVQQKKFISDSCLNSNYHYKMSNSKNIFVKSNASRGANKLFRGEFESLKAILNTNTVMVPKPYYYGTSGDGQNYIVMQYFKNMSKLRENTWGKIGSQFADMHLHNIQQKNSSKIIKRFGFHVETSPGIIPQNNSWTDDWITFFTENRMMYNIHMLKTKYSENKKAKIIIEKYWPKVKKMIPLFFKGIDVKPSLLHGDFWNGNIDESDSIPIIYDPASFYGHHEYDIALILYFGVHNQDFLKEYFKKIPKAKYFNKRVKLYQAFHILHHWNMFGIQHARSAVTAFKKLVNHDKKYIPDYPHLQTREGADDMKKYLNL